MNLDTVACIADVARKAELLGKPRNRGTHSDSLDSPG
jgi:hypothetical protein